MTAGMGWVHCRSQDIVAGADSEAQGHGEDRKENDGA